MLPSRAALTTQTSFLQRYGVALLATLCALAVAALCMPFTGVEMIYIFFFFAVMVSSWYGGLGPGLVTALLSIAVVHLLLVPPVGMLNITSSGQIVAAVVFLLEGSLVSGLNMLHRRTKDSLRTSHRSIYNVVDSINDGFYAVDRQWRLIYANQRFEQTVGQPREMLIGKNLWEAFPAAVGTEIYQKYHAAMATRQPLRIEYFVPTYNTWMDIHAYPSPDGMTVYFQDITERRAIEERTRFQASALAQVRDAVVALNSQNQITYWNQRAEELSHIRAENALGRSPYEVPALRWTLPANIEKTVPGQPPDSDSWTGANTLTVDGKRLSLEHTVSILHDERGEPAGRLCVIRDISRRVQAETERNQLLNREQVARVRAEAVQRRLSFLAEASRELAVSLDYRTTLDSLARLAVPTLADWCMVDIVDEQRAINRVALAHIEPAEEQRLRHAQKQHPLTWQSQRPVVQVLQSGQANLFSHIDCANPQASGAAFEAPDLVYETGICSVMIVPLKARGAIVGAMTLGSLRQHRHYEAHDLVLAEDLAHRAALAVDNARLYGDAQLARAEANALAGRSTFLAEVSRILTTSFNHERTLYEVAHLSVPFLADWCIIDVVHDQDNDQLQRTEAADHNIRSLAGNEHTPPSPATPVLVATPPLLTRVLETGRSEFYPELPAALLAGLASSAEHLRLLHTVQPQSAIIVPLIAQQRNLGTITCFAFTSGHRYQLGDLTLAEDLAHRVALAIDNARLYFEVQEAVRIRDQFFSIASHELKTPLTSLMGYSRLLQSLAQRDNLTEREQRGIRIITEQTDRLSRLINALLDISRIRMGRLSIEQTAVDIAVLTQRVVEEVQVMLEQHTLTLELPAQPLIVDGDMLRLEQVLQNLIQNAIKYSPEGGSIEVRLTQQDNHACIAVSDHGIGIAPEALSEMFQPFYRAPNAATQQIVGMGIGLYVVKEIVTLHSGEVDVESQEGAGSTFTVRLPLAPVAAPLPTAPSAP